MRYKKRFFYFVSPTSSRFFPLFLSAALLSVTSSQASQDVSPFAYNPVNPLTEAETVRLSMARPAFSGLMEGQLALAESGLTSARIWPNPDLQYSRETVDRSTGDSTENSIWISQRFQVSGARGLQKDAARTRIEAAESGVLGDRVAMEADARQLFHRLLHQHHLVLAVEHWASRMSSMAGVVDKRQRAGEVSGYDALRLSRERAAVSASLQQEQSTRFRLWAAMSALLGGPDEAARYDGISGELLPVAPPDLATLLAALAERPDLVQLEREVAALDLERRASARGWVPELTLGVGQKRISDDLGRDTGPMVAAGISLPLFDRGQVEVQRLTARAEIERNRYQLMLQRAQGEVTGRWQELTGLRSAALEARRGADEEALEMIRIAEAAYEGGELVVLELLDAYRSAYLAEIQALELSAAARLASIELDLLTGGAVE